MKTKFTVIATVLGFVSAGLWFWSASLKPVYPMGYLSGPPKEIVDRVKLQAKLNALAALCTGGAVLFQTLAAISN